MARESVCMPDKFINKQANGVTDAVLRYARPLIGELPIMERIAAPKVARILKNK